MNQRIRLLKYVFKMQKRIRELEEEQENENEKRDK